MIINFKYGFHLNEMLFGWKEKKLFRLPQKVGKKNYPLKELPLIDVGAKKGYLIRGERKSLKQLECLTIFINFEHHEIKDSDLPF